MFKRTPDKAKDADASNKPVAKADAGITKWLDGMQIVKVILVPGRLLNIVVRPE